MKTEYSFFHINQGDNAFSTEEYQYWIILSGTGQFIADDWTIRFMTHDIIEIPYHKSFRVICDTDLQIGRIILPNFQTRNTEFQIKSYEYTELIRRTFFFAMEYKGMRHQKAASLFHYIDDLMYETLLITGLEEYKINDRLALAIDEINQNALNPDYDPNDTIEKSGYSASYFRKLFLEETGISVVHFVQKRRIEYAKYLMTQYGQMEIKEIAEQCGFTDAYYFTRVFRKWEGIAPTAYRKQSDYMRVF